MTECLAPALKKLAAAIESGDKIPVGWRISIRKESETPVSRTGFAITGWKRPRPCSHAAETSFPGALNNLSWHLAACPDPALRKPREALPLIRQAGAITDRRDPKILDTMATVCAANALWPESEGALTDAITIARAANHPAAAAQFEATRRNIKARQP